MRRERYKEKRKRKRKKKKEKEEEIEEEGVVSSNMEEYETEEEIENIVEEEIEVSDEEEQVTVYNAEEFKESKWYFSNEEKIKYKQYFIAADTNKDGLIQPKEAFEFFIKSQLDKKVLGKIWNLVEDYKQGGPVSKDVGLDPSAFYAMFHIVFHLRKNQGKLECPDKIPPCLHHDIIEKLGTNVVSKIKIKKKF